MLASVSRSVSSIDTYCTPRSARDGRARYRSFGLGLFARYQADPERFRVGYADLLSRAGMDTAEQLGMAFGLDVSDPAFWAGSVEVIRDRIAQYESMAGELGML